jgi:hypothetical protein
MRVPWKIAVPISCIALISGAAVAWQVLRVRANGLKLAQDATVCRVRAEQGDAKAEANLANMYSHGQGVPQDYAEAVRWYRKAADQGDPQGQDGLAFMYFRGQGVPQDYAEAVHWYRKAADQGYARSQYNLGNMYYYGQGLPQDRADAGRWYHKAADQGDEYAQRALGLKGPGLSSLGAITLSAMFLGCLWALKDFLSPQPSLRHRQQRALTLAGLCGVGYIGLSLYGAFGIFPSVLTVNAFHFVKNLVAGIAMATLICMLRPKSVKVVLGISGVLLIGTDLIVIWRHALTRFITTIRGFSSVNGLLIGMAVPFAIFLWRENIKRARDKQAAG